MLFSIKLGASIKKAHFQGANREQVESYLRSLLADQCIENLKDLGEHHFSYNLEGFKFGYSSRGNPFRNFNYGEFKISENPEYINIDFSADLRRLFIRAAVFTLVCLILLMVLSKISLMTFLAPFLFGALFLLFRYLGIRTGTKIYLQRRIMELKTWRK
ncbi:hypothetical protein [Croceimicrobium hydrocarbonivorans]|uniref:Uncharacterized protein n=1 Tax=Croceimicrobium hydrocarbonivorans TaxID=2761580 RepID=A0A7H0VDD8_9FLAO|nr:hypothetical protein [Croceimicrobium hydrocarbonivorans]QNR23736.1 hypothetical protein H4K34_15355 [Croceimicrobium hydrocarbonivorans]